MPMKENEYKEIRTTNQETDTTKQQTIAPPILEEITIEELAVDGICGIY
jgi:mycofactocin precursor